MQHLQFITTIQAPFDKVWAYRMDAARLPDWLPSTGPTSSFSVPLDQPGAEYRVRFDPLGTTEIKVLEVTPMMSDKRRFQNAAYHVAGTATLRLMPNEDRTQIILDAEYEFAPSGTREDATLEDRVKHQFEQELNRFKAFVEAEIR